DPNLAKRRIRGVPVLGTMHDIGRIAARTGAETLIVAISTADAALLRRIQDIADRSGLSVKVMPAIGHVVANGVHGATYEISLLKTCLAGSQSRRTFLKLLTI